MKPVQLTLGPISRAWKCWRCGAMLDVDVLICQCLWKSKPPKGLVIESPELTPEPPATTGAPITQETAL